MQEKLFYRQPARGLTVAVDDLKEHYLAGETVRLKVSVRDENDRPAQAALGVRVWNEALVEAAGTEPVLLAEAVRSADGTSQDTYERGAAVEKERLASRMEKLREAPQADALALQPTAGAAAPTAEEPAHPLPSTAKNELGDAAERFAEAAAIPAAPTKLVANNLAAVQSQFRSQAALLHDQWQAWRSMLGRILVGSGVVLLAVLALIALFRLPLKAASGTLSLTAAAASLVVGLVWIGAFPEQQDQQVAALPSGATQMARDSGKHPRPDCSRDGRRGSARSRFARPPFPPTSRSPRSLRSKPKRAKRPLLPLHPRLPLRLLPPLRRSRHCLQDQAVVAWGAVKEKSAEDKVAGRFGGAGGSKPGESEEHKKQLALETADLKRMEKKAADKAVPAPTPAAPAPPAQPDSNPAATKPGLAKSSAPARGLAPTDPDRPNAPRPTANGVADGIPLPAAAPALAGQAGGKDATAGEAAKRARLQQLTAAPASLYFNPQLLADDQGHAVIEFQMPAVPSAYRVLIDAYGNGRVGGMQTIVECRAGAGSEVNAITRNSRRQICLR